MEYELKKDLIWGKRLRLGEEHTLVERWFNDELTDNPELAQQFIAALNADSATEMAFQGKEVLATVYHGEVQFVAHSLFHDADGDDFYAQQDLYLDEQGQQAACGVEDLREVAAQWLEFN